MICSENVGLSVWEASLYSIGHKSQQRCYPKYNSWQANKMFRGSLMIVLVSWLCDSIISEMSWSQLFNFSTKVEGLLNSNKLSCLRKHYITICKFKGSPMLRWNCFSLYKEWRFGDPTFTNRQTFEFSFFLSFWYTF